MRASWPTITTAAVTLAVLVGVRVSGAQQPPAAQASTTAAKVEGEVITLEEVEQGLTNQLRKIEEQRYTLIEARLQQLIGDRLLAREAQKRGMTIDQLLKVEVDAKAPDVSDDEVASFIAQNRARLPRGDEADLRMKVRDYLRQPRVDERRQALIQSLRAQSTVAVYLDAPAAVRAPVSRGLGFVRGAPEAPVTIVEFSDFQCPFCRKATPIVKQILDMYPGKVKLVFRDFPIASLHPGALKAHEAARCAADQGKFWEYHDVLFEGSVSGKDLTRYAAALDLDPSAFAECLESGRHQADVNADIEEGAGLGVTATPTFFINGRQLLGAQPLAAFQRLIDSELAARTFR